MSTIVIKTEDNPLERFEIDLANEPKEFAEEFRKFVSKLRARSNVAERRARKKLSPKLQKATQYLESLSHITESVETLKEADEIRRDWIRKYD